MTLNESVHRQELKTYLLALTQKEASLFPSLAELIERIIVYMHNGIKDDDLEKTFKLADGAFDLLIINNKKELAFIRSDKELKNLETVFTLSLSELMQLKEELELLMKRPSEERAAEIERLLAKLNADEQKEVNLVREAT